MKQATMAKELFPIGTQVVDTLDGVRGTITAHGSTSAYLKNGVVVGSIMLCVEWETGTSGMVEAIRDDENNTLVCRLEAVKPEPTKPTMEFRKVKAGIYVNDKHMVTIEKSGHSLWVVYNIDDSIVCEGRTLKAAIEAATVLFEMSVEDTIAMAQESIDKCDKLLAQCDELKADIQATLDSAGEPTTAQDAAIILNNMIEGSTHYSEQDSEYYILDGGVVQVYSELYNGWLDVGYHLPDDLRTMQYYDSIYQAGIIQGKLCSTVEV